MEVGVGVFRLVDGGHGKAVAIVLGVGIVAKVAVVVGVYHQVPGDALAALHGRDDPQPEVRAGGVVVVGRDGGAVYRGILAHGHDGASKSSLRAH